jgi:NADPH:quinone reductase-like Zn-dependent oxidoreductase
VTDSLGRAGTMAGVVLPGNSTVEHVTLPVPEPGHGQVLLVMKASSIRGGDPRAIYREHLGTGPEAYVTDRFPPWRGADAYRVAGMGAGGQVCTEFD